MFPPTHGWVNFTFGKKIMKTLILLLTIIPAFTCFASSGKSENSTDPQKSEAKSKEVTHDLIIDVSENGEWTVEGKTLTEESLRKRLKNDLAADNDLKVLLRASSKLEFQKVIKVMDLCKKAGVTQIAMATQK